MIRRLALDLILPIECLNCSRPGEYFCANCQTDLKINDLKSSLSLIKSIKHNNLDGVFVAGDYDDALLQELIIKYKYHFIEPLGEILGSFLSDFWKKNTLKNFLNNQSPLLIPMPLSKKRLRWRGFNQTVSLAQKLSSKFGYKISSGLQRRHRRPQAELDENERLKNLNNAFYWQGGNIAGQILIIIDDVITIGATISEASQALKNAGAVKVFALAIAKG